MSDLNGVEDLNSKWLKAYKELAWASSLGGCSTKGYLISNKDEAIGFDLDGKMILPGGSRELVDRMALFCRADMVIGSPPPEMGKKFPSTYWAHSLLYASYPRYQGIFKGHNGAVHVMCLSSLDKSKLDFCIFQGLGVILMESVRPIICPFDDEETLLAKSKEYYICIEG